MIANLERINTKPRPLRPFRVMLLTLLPLPFLLTGCVTYKLTLKEPVKPNEPLSIAVYKLAESAQVMGETELPVGKYEILDQTGERTATVRITADTIAKWTITAPKGSFVDGAIQMAALRGEITFSRPVLILGTVGLGDKVTRIDIGDGHAAVKLNVGRALLASLIEAGRKPKPGEKLPSVDQWLKKVKVAQFSVKLGSGAKLELGKGTTLVSTEGIDVSLSHWQWDTGVAKSVGSGRSGANQGRSTGKWKAAGELNLSSASLHLRAENGDEAKFQAGSFSLPYSLSGETAKPSTVTLGGPAPSVLLKELAWSSSNSLRQVSANLEHFMISSFSLAGNIPGGGRMDWREGQIVVESTNGFWHSTQQDAEIVGSLGSVRLDGKFSTNDFEVHTQSPLRIRDVDIVQKNQKDSVRLELPELNFEPLRFGSTQQGPLLRGKGVELTIRRITRVQTNEVLRIDAGSSNGICSSQALWTFPQTNPQALKFRLEIPDGQLIVERKDSALSLKGVRIVGNFSLDPKATNDFQLRGASGDGQFELKDNTRLSPTIMVEELGIVFEPAARPKINIHGFEIGLSFAELQKASLVNPPRSPYDMHSEWPRLQLLPLIKEGTLHTREGWTQLREIFLTPLGTPGRIKVVSKVNIGFPVTYDELVRLNGFRWPFSAEEVLGSSLTQSSSAVPAYVGNSDLRSSLEPASSVPAASLLARRDIIALSSIADAVIRFDWPPNPLPPITLPPNPLPPITLPPNPLPPIRLLPNPLPPINEVVRGAVEGTKNLGDNIRDLGKQVEESLKFGGEAAVGSLGKFASDLNTASLNLGRLVAQHLEELKRELEKILQSPFKYESRSTSLSATPKVVAEDVSVEFAPKGRLRDTELTIKCEWAIKTYPHGPLIFPPPIVPGVGTGVYVEPFIMKPDGGHELVRFWLYTQGTILGAMVAGLAPYAALAKPQVQTPLSKQDGWIGDLQVSSIKFKEWNPERFSIRVDAEGQLP
jgi:hypothetical protein